jgi:uncharacterized protein DUF5916/cellulose/xylan binding protein with CBM9 domain
MARFAMPLRPICLLSLNFVCAGVLAAQARDSLARPPAPNHSAAPHALPSPSVQASRRSEPITLDGRLDEPIWAATQAATDFRQAQPKVGDPATQRTEIRILFDDEALYVGARMFDDQGAAGVRSQLVRRDQNASSSDQIQLVLDTFHNHIGRTVFTVNPSGVKQDAGQAAANADPSWDPVWLVKTQVDSLGWTAEFRIPFSQLRFPRDSVQAWGMQVWRTETRLNEVSMWSFWGPNESGGPPRFGHIEGIAPGRGATRRLEVLPYIVGRYRRLETGDTANPFYKPRHGDARVGADVKYLLNSNLTLDATINPDFGQVEVDPAVVNLSAFETFFPERRPFFVEGSGTFGFGGFNCFFCSNVSSLSLFYSRRIGRTPQGLLPDGTTYSDIPDASTILGAGKITGRTRSGFTVGLLDAVTAREHATALVNGTQQSEEVEPFTNYFVGRLKKDFNRGNLVLGAMGTSVARSTDNALLLSRLNSHSEALGLDWSARWKNQMYSFVGNLAFTNNVGDPAAIRRLQNSSARYFQRPDRQAGSNALFSDRYDPDATVFRGLGGYSRFGKDAGKLLFETALNWRTPGFEANDLAFNTKADYVWMNANLALSLAQPTKWYRNYFLVLGNQREYNFDGDRTDTQIHAGAFGQLLNYWGVSFFGIRRTDTEDDRMLRGGPVVIRPGNWFFSSGLNSDSRKRVSFNAGPNLSRGDLGNVSWGANFGVNLRPASNLTMSFSPSFNRSRAAVQYVTARPDPIDVAFYGTRYILSDLSQKTAGFDTRINLTLRPTLTFELYAQPFISSVHYRRFKQYAAPRSGNLLVFGEDLGTVSTQQDADGKITGYTIDPDAAGPAAPITFANPDFVLRSLRGNAVLRWEYRPGSTLFLVWTRTSSDFAQGVGDFRFSRDTDALFGAKADNIFLIKLNYWLNR